MIDEGLLHNSFGVQILLHFVPILLPAGEGQIEAGPGVIGVADMTSDPGPYPALQDPCAKGTSRRPIERNDVAPDR